MSIKTVVETFLVQSHAADIVKLDADLIMAKNLAKMVYADPETCDEDTFAQCLVDSQAVDLAMFRESTLWNLFASDCAVDNGCTTPCINQEFNVMEWNYESWEEYEVAYNASGCRPLEDNLYEQDNRNYEADRTAMRAVEEVAMSEFEQSQEAV